jgi:hypothetical protein
MTKIPQKSAAVDLALASTSRNERHNGTVRNFISRFQRFTYGFSKDLDNHRFAHAIYAFWYNFRKQHRSLRYDTPAMRAGIADHIWTWDEILDEVDRYWADVNGVPQPEPPVLDGTILTPMEPGTRELDSEFFVCHDTVGNTAKVHAGYCRNCRYGLGRGGSGKVNRWYHFHDRSTAEAAAALLAPDDHSVCSICIKRQYRTRTQPL